MPVGQVLEFSRLTKRYGSVSAVNDFTARVEPGSVTGFLGPNGAGKTTSLRILLGLVKATSGAATIGGKPYASLREPLREVGAVLEAASFHPGRTAANHLRIAAHAGRIPVDRVDEVLGLVGLADVAGRKVGGFSLGMRQRLGLAFALLGDPGVLVLDEPANGLDPEGIKWMRSLLRTLAREGRTVLMSSHLLSEVQQTADQLVMIAQGRLVYQGRTNEIVDPRDESVVVDSPDRGALAAALTASGTPFQVLRSGLSVKGASPAKVGRIAADAGVALSALAKRGPALEEAFLDLVSGARLHPSATGVPIAPAALPPGSTEHATAAEEDADDAAAVPASHTAEGSTAEDTTAPATTDSTVEPDAAAADAPAEPTAAQEDAPADSVTGADASTGDDVAPLTVSFVTGHGGDAPATSADPTRDDDTADDVGTPDADTADGTAVETVEQGADDEPRRAEDPADDAPARPSFSFAGGFDDVLAPADPATLEEAPESAPVEDMPAWAADLGRSRISLDTDFSDVLSPGVTPDSAPADAETPGDGAEPADDVPAEHEHEHERVATSTASFAVASTGVIDIVPPADEQAGDDASGNVDGRDLGPRTEADDAADAFFAAFDNAPSDDVAEEPAPEAGADEEGSEQR